MPALHLDTSEADAEPSKYYACARLRLGGISRVGAGLEIVFFDSKADNGMFSNPVVIEQPTDPELCPVATLRQCINKTAAARVKVVN